MATLHLNLQEIVVNPSREWLPDSLGWILIRVSSGTAYCFQKNGPVNELGASDGVILGFRNEIRLRASLLGPLKLQTFAIYPQNLNVLTVDEWHQFKMMSKQSSGLVFLFCANDTIGQKFTQIVSRRHGNELVMRFALLQLWAETAVAILKPADQLSKGAGQLRLRFHSLFSQMTVFEFFNSSSAELSQHLNCSTRHFHRLFRTEFGMRFQAFQTELRSSRLSPAHLESGAATETAEKSNSDKTAV